MRCGEGEDVANASGKSSIKPSKLQRQLSKEPGYDGSLTHVPSKQQMDDAIADAGKIWNT
jgi:hypothetical protein